MSTKHKLALVPTLIVAGTTIAGVVLVSARSTSRSAIRRNTTTITAPLPAQRSYVHRGALWPQLRLNLKALGDRLERPGKEQVILTGSMTRAGVPNPLPVVLNIEAPSRMTLTMQSGLQTQVVTFDGTQSSTITLTPPERDLVETLFFDTAESFFFGEMKGSATRCLGFRFPLNEPGSSDQFYDLYAVTPQSNPTSVTGAKLFHFNSETLFLYSVRYQVERNGGSVQIETRLTNWQDSDGQKIARRIERLENGTTVMTLVVNNVVFSPAPGGAPL